jgi:hypothetical protein
MAEQSWLKTRLIDRRREITHKVFSAFMLKLKECLKVDLWDLVWYGMDRIIWLRIGTVIGLF